MKKILFALFILLALLFLLFSGCVEEKMDSWDGSVALSFADGEGTQDNPYIIATAEQLAFLAQEINSGKDCADKFFSLKADLDMNDIEWTPIGTALHSFKGAFHGNNHTIRNLKITQGVHDNQSNASGLFGHCTDAHIKDLRLDNVEIVLQSASNVERVYAGALSGMIQVDAAAEISNIIISNTRIAATPQVNSARSLHVGGVCGYVTAKKGADTFASKLQSDVTVSLEEGETSYNYVGGLFGNISSLGACDITNAASYLTLDLNNEYTYWADNRFGAFGITLTANDVFSVTNVFSKVTVDEINVNIHGYSAYTANAIIGEAFHGKQSDGTVVGGYEFNNLFGFVQQLDQITGVREVQETLYHMPTHAIYMESNCRGCESLPTDSGFDTGIWELNDPSMPKIK